MRGRTLFLLGIATGFCAIPITCHPGRGHYEMNLVPVVVAAVDLPAGTVVTFDQISQRSFPEQFVTSASVKPDSAGHIVNQRLVKAVNAGEVMQWADFGPERAELKGDSRMFTIELDPARAVGGALAKGDHVDVLAALPDPVSHLTTAQTLVENAIVLSLTARQAPERTTVQLMVNPEAAQRLLLTQELGSFALAIRSPDDVQVAAPAPVTLGEVLHPPPPGPRCSFSMLRVRPGALQ